MSKTKEQIKAERDALVKQAYANIEEAQKLSDEIEEGFSFSVAYGMGGYYTAAGEDYYGSSCYGEDEEGEWHSSSMSC